MNLKTFIFFTFLTICALESPPEAAARWRSELYPENWTPGYQDAQGRFLHDFSYAGYQSGASPIPDNPPGPVFNAAADFGADGSGTADSTAAIQKAIDTASAAGGGIVFIPKGYYRLDGVLEIHQPHVVIRGEGADATQLRFTQSDGMSDRAHITFNGKVARKGDILLAADGVNQSLSVAVQDTTGLHIGDEVSVGWIITPEFVAEHQMTGTWTISNGKWKAFFRRKVIALNTTTSPPQVTLDIPLRYPAKTRDSASLRVESGYLEECGLEHLGVSNAVDTDSAWKQNQVHAVAFNSAKNSWIQDVTTFAPREDKVGRYHLQSSGILVVDSKQMTIADTRMQNAQNRGGGGNGYLFEVRTTNELLIRDSQGSRGRHNFIQNWDFGTTGCVFLRIRSSRGWSFSSQKDVIGFPTFSEYHHSLSMANLVDQSELDDGWLAINRGQESTGGGITSTENVFWNIHGGLILTWQYGWGYVIGTTKTWVVNRFRGWVGTDARGTAPDDFVEGKNQGTLLDPPSLYEDQLQRRRTPTIVQE